MHKVQVRTLGIVIAHAETSRVFAHVRAHDRDGLTEYLTGYIHGLKAAGATVAAIPAVAPHFCVRELIASSPLPDSISSSLSARSLQHEGLGG